MVAPVYLLLLPRIQPVSDLNTKQKLAKIDFVGATLTAGAFTSAVMAISFGGSVFSWRSAKIIGLLVYAGVLWLAFILQ